MLCRSGCKAQNVEPTEWGWELLDGILNPVMSSKAVSLETVVPCVNLTGKICSYSQVFSLVLLYSTTAGIIK